MKLGIIGLPSSGKTSLFNALTGFHKDTAADFSKSGKPSIGIVKVPDMRMEFLKKMFKPKKFTLANVEFVDIVGVFAEASKTNNPMATLRETDGIIQVIRLFEDDSIPHIKGSIDPKRDLADMEADLLISDLDVIENRIEKLKVAVKKPTKNQEKDKEELEIMNRCKDALDNNQGLNTIELNANEEKILRCYTFLTQKPRIIVLNVGEDQINDQSLGKNLFQDSDEIPKICGKLEAELAALNEEDRTEFQNDLGIEELASGKIINASCKALNIIHFFTVGDDEVKAWEIHKGDNAVTAAGKIHSDIAQGFIRAETIGFNDLNELGNLREVKAKGKSRLEGKDYIVKDGDIINFRFNV